MEVGGWEVEVEVELIICVFGVIEVGSHLLAMEVTCNLNSHLTCHLYPQLLSHVQPIPLILIFPLVTLPATSTTIVNRHPSSLLTLKSKFDVKIKKYSFNKLFFFQIKYFSFLV